MIDRGYLFQPDLEVRQQIRMLGGMPDLHQFEKVFISCSGGKDSQAMSYLISNLAEVQKYPKDNIELIYADTGLEWHDTYNHVQVIGRALGIKTVKVLPKFKLLDNVRRRWKKFTGIDLDAPNSVGGGADSRKPDAILTKTEISSIHSQIINEDIATMKSGSLLMQKLETHQFQTPFHPKRKDGITGASPFPNQTQRFCNSDHKRTPINHWIIQSVRFQVKKQDSAHHGENRMLFTKEFMGHGREPQTEGG